ncbi:MAG: hypothetical protein ACP5N7_04205 [Candidatus Pacearchaeota archaeon]
MAVSRLNDVEKPRKSKKAKEKAERINVSCGNDKGTCDEKKPKGENGRTHKSNYRKEVIYDKTNNEPTQTKVKEEHILHVTDAKKEQEDEKSGGLVFKGKTSQKTTDSGNKEAGKSDMSAAKEIRYFKTRNKIGKLLTGQTEKQMGGRLESQTKTGEKEVITFKGKGRGAKKFIEKKDIEEKEKNNYNKAKSEQESKVIKDFDYETKLANMPYVRYKQSGGTEDKYKLGNASDKEWKVSKNSYKYDVKDVRKANKKKDVKVTREALSKIRING